MSMNINEFKANFQGGGARANRFRVTMPFPVFAGGAAESKKLTFTCKAAQLPESTVGVIEVPYMGRQLKLAGDRTFAEWTITILNDTDFSVRNAFEKWMNGINSHEANVGLNFREIFTDAVVQQLGQNDKVLKSYSIKGVFPTNLSSIDVAWDSNDQVEEFTVSLQVQYWTAITTS